MTSNTTSIHLPRTGQNNPCHSFGLWKVSKSTSADASDYGNETEAGDGVRRAVSDGLLWNTFHAKEHVKTLAQTQLDSWGLDYFDLFLVHFPIALKYVDPAERYPPEWFGVDGKTVHLQDTPMQETWTAMEELVDLGIVNNIGISNCQGSLLLDIFRYARIKPQVLQVELHPYLTQEGLVALAKQLGVATTAYSSLGPQGYYELSMDRGAPSLLTVDTVTSIAKQHNKSPAQVLLRWATQRGTAVIPKSNIEQQYVENLGIQSFTLKPEEMKAISALNCNLRMNDPADIDPRLSIFA
ncbi:NADP-dependent oxidoreductase domain-containing protein [Mycena leptocephala]|nr:NADP-dependent oxidoreductase domain-containing protein [Mycena leptocephala]